MVWLRALVTSVSAAIVALIVYHFKPKKERPWRIANRLNSTYDYIVIGAGSAGSALASRLSEDANVSVLVLEAGPEDTTHQGFNIPCAVLAAQRTECDWSFETLPQKHSSWGMNNKVSFWPRGRLLGGSSHMNAMMYIRGNRRDYDSWAENGCAGWSYKDVLPYFLKSEDIDNASMTKEGYHRQGGYLHVSSRTFVPKLQKALFEAAKSLGLKYRDPNGAEQEGVFVNCATVKNGVRWNADRAFLRPVMDRDNLHIAVNALVQKVLIENKKATGISVIHGGVKKIISANKEVILSAGAVSSPQILMLSGIGPRKHLEQLHIQVKADLPVGDNLQDHLILFMKFIFKAKSVSLTAPRMQGVSSLLKFLLFGKGPLAAPGAIDAVGFVRLDKNTTTPDIEFLFIPGHFEPTGMGKVSNCNSEITEELRKRLFKYGPNTNGMTIAPYLLYPKSHGTIRLKSTDPFDHPAIDPHYLEDARDVKTLADGCKFIDKLANADAFKAFGVESVLPQMPESEITEFGSDRMWESYVRHWAQTVYHPVGTCKMGSMEDSTTVVDSRLRVKGISGLRVVDASVMPTIIGGNTNAPTIMIAEKAADMIKGDNR